MPTMITYENIYGWFEYEWLYDMMLAQVQGPATFVEIGTFLGKSTVYMAEQIRRSGKQIKFYAIDNFKGNDEHRKDYEVVLGPDFESFYTVFHYNLVMSGAKDFVIPVQSDAADAAKAFEDRSLDFVFIDASHTFEAVQKDIAAWLPKIKARGYLGGHDRGFPGVQQALRLFFPHWTENGNCWLVQVA